MIEAAQKMGIKVMVFESNRYCPASGICDDFIEADFDDIKALSDFRKACDVFTVETENIPQNCLEYLSEKKVLRPNKDSILITQNRILEKEFFRSLSIPTVPFVEVNSDNINNVDKKLFPGILKTARFGYDGKGQRAIRDQNQLSKFGVELKEQQFILERRVPLEMELSLILVRDKSGNVGSYPLSKNRHENGILVESVMPAKVSDKISGLAFTYGEQIARKLGYIGVLTIEFFLSNNELLVNEVAPRPHNSGHQTIIACATSQFEQQVRMCVDLPIGETTLFHDVRLENILGDLWFSNNNEEPKEPDWEAITRGDKRLKLYGKNEPRVGRKMGHMVTLVRPR